MAVTKIARPFGSVAIFSCLLLAASCGTQEKPAENRRASIVAAHIDAFRKGPSAEQEEHIWTDLIDRFHRNPELASDEDMNALIKLMSAPNDMDRERAAIVLGELGMRARPAAPALISAFKEVECLRVDRSSAQSIAAVLTKINVPIPFSGCNPFLETMITHKGEDYIKESESNTTTY